MNIEDASKNRSKIRSYFNKIGLTQNLDTLRGLSRDERILKQKERIEKAIEEETNPIEKKKFQNLLNNYLAANDAIGKFLKEKSKVEIVSSEYKDKEGKVKKTTRNKNIGSLRSEYKKEIIKNQEEKQEKIKSNFTNEKLAKYFEEAKKLIKEIDELEISINRAHLEMVDRLPGAEEYFDDLLNEKEKLENSLDNIKREEYTAYRSAKLISLNEDLKKEGHIARVDSTKEDLKFISEALLTGNPVFLHGPTGTGKTSLARFAAKELTLHRPYMVYCNPQTKESNIFGRQSIDVENGASKTYFDLGPLAKAMKEGKVCIFDEFTSLPKEQMSMIKGILNHKVGDSVDIPGNGDIKIKEGFQIIYTANLKSDKNKERNDLPPEMANESAMLNLEIKYQSPEEGYDIFLSRIINDEGSTNFSSFDLENTIPNLLKAMKDIQDAYQGVSSRDFMETLNMQDGGSSKIVSLKKFVLNQRSISQLLDIWNIRKKRENNISFIEFLDKSLLKALNFGEYKEDKLLATKILVNRGLLSTISAKELGLDEDDLSIGSRSVSTEKSNLDKSISSSKEIITMTIQELAELDPYGVKAKFREDDIENGFVNKSGKKIIPDEYIPPLENIKSVDLDKLDKALENLNSKARIDRNIENGSITITLNSNDMKYLKTKEKALKQFENANHTPIDITENFQKLLWDTITKKTLQIVIINHGETSPEEREKLVKDMDILGYRPLTVAESTALAIKRVDLFDKYKNTYFNSYITHKVDSVLHAPYFGWVGGWRGLGAVDVGLDWDDLSRFVFVRK